MEENKALEQEKWEFEKSIREREFMLNEKELEVKESELELRHKEHARSEWRNPLVVAILATTIAATGNAIVAAVNGQLQRQLEDQKSEQSRILEMIKTGDADKAADNLEFLLNAGLITNQERATKIRGFLATREPGSGPTLPTFSQKGPIFGGIVGVDDAVLADSLPTGTAVSNAAKSVGVLHVLDKNGNTRSQCTAFLVDESLVLSASFCTEKASKATFTISNKDQKKTYDVILPPEEQKTDIDDLNFALLRLNGKPGKENGFLRLKNIKPQKDQSLNIIMFRGDGKKFAVINPSECRVVAVEKNIFHHLCDTGGGSSGSPILSAKDGEVLGMHFRRGRLGGVAVRIDKVLGASNSLSDLY